jgi:hypothetical protein
VLQGVRRRTCPAGTISGTSFEEPTVKKQLTLFVALMLAGACANAPAGGNGANVVEPDGDAAAEAADGDAEQNEAGGEDPVPPEDAAEGTRDNPLPIGTQVEIRDWTVAITSVDKDATEAVLAHNQFNDPPAEGHRYVMFSVEATYNGDESGNPFVDFAWAVVGSDGNTFSDGCGSIGNHFDDNGEAFPGAVVSGDKCFSVPAEQVDGATITVEAWLHRGTRVFYAVD